MADFPGGDVRVPNEHGELEVLHNNEPRTDLKPPRRPSRMVDVRSAGLAGIRVRAEHILSQTCGEQDLIAQLTRLGPDVGAILVKIARQPNDRGSGPFRRSGAVAALGAFATAEAADALRDLVDDRTLDEELRCRAALSLGRIGSPSSVRLLQQVLDKDRSAAVRRAASQGLALSTSLEATAALGRAAEHDPDPVVRRQAHAALGTLERLHGMKLTNLRRPARPRRRQPEPLPSPEERRR